ncbi:MULTISPECIES: hypothetical protein [Acidobacteriaceae]|uniref:hypothetical protein n=1 Tax=Acidobacteriaceae TaxID=204434 RepID=UPI00131B7C8C|nr:MULTISPECIES: hypothetical protein [Acidobacteriaceae]MDW5266821.1 hypothetical protein [Edaphobacter sp.]
MDTQDKTVKVPALSGVATTAGAKFRKKKRLKSISAPPALIKAAITIAQVIVSLWQSGYHRDIGTLM